MNNNNLENFKFDKSTHTYYLNDTVLPSVSSLIKKVSIPFDANIISKRMESCGKGNAEDLKQQWKDKANASIVKGNTIHDLAENIAKSHISFPHETKNIINFYSDLFSQKDAIILMSEEMIYSSKYKIAGTLDLVVRYNNTDHIAMYDFKTNKDIHKNYKGQKLSFPFDNYLDTPLNKYIIQQSLYSLMLRERGIHLDSLNLVYIPPNDEYEIIELEDLSRYDETCGTNKIEQWLQSLNISAK